MDIPYEDFVPHKFSRRCVRNFYEYPEGSRITNRSQLPTPGQAPEPGFNNVLFLWLDHLHESMSKKELKKLGKLVRQRQGARTDLHRSPLLVLPLRNTYPYNLPWHARFL